MLRIEHQVILRRSIEVRVLCWQSLHPAAYTADNGAARLCNASRRKACCQPVSPPVVQVPRYISQGVLQLGTDGCIQFLEGNHFHLDVRTIAPVVRASMVCKISSAGGALSLNTPDTAVIIKSYP